MRHSARCFLAAVFMLAGGILPAQKCSARDSLSIGGKGMYLWQLWTTNGGGRNLDSIIARLHHVGVGWMVTKMGDGDSYYNSPDHSLFNWVVANYGSMDSVVSVLHRNGIKLLAFQYVYGVPNHWGNPVSETDVANMILDVKGIDGLLIDAEIEYDTLATRVASARGYCDSVRVHHPGSFVGLTSWARINGHATFPWESFLDRVDVNMPQTYWAARPTTPQNELSLMNGQFASATAGWVSQGDSAAAKPIMPLGQGEYFGYSNDVVPGDVAGFSTLARTAYGYPGISLWEYNQISHDYVWDEYAAAWPTTSIQTANAVPDRCSLSQNFPNPFNPTTTITYSLQSTTRVTLRVFDILGREVAELVNENRTPGTHDVRFDGSNLSSGVYFYRLQAGSFNQTKKLVIVR